ncbi:MAG: RsmE family RNA methyltransferase [Armatimonadota bacterium]|nr:RsmE family RNA methyltransferase [Armatimonadota bacterium]
MTDHRFFVEPEQISDGRVTIRGPQARQICAVLRLQTGDTISALDGSGCCHIARIGSLTRDEVIAEIIETSQADTEARVRLTLAQALAKGHKVEMVVQKATELGISGMVVFASERTIVRPAEDKIRNRLARWRSIAREAAEQSCRAVLPDVDGVIGFDDLVQRVSQFDKAFVAWEKEKGLLLREALKDAETGNRILLIVGPEGGFSEDEVSQAIAAGAVPISLGARTLRTETAAIAGCAIVLHSVEQAVSRNCSGDTKS